MGTGLVQLAWICRETRRAYGPVGTTTQLAGWSTVHPLLLWEAFVSAGAKSDRSSTGNAADAKLAVDDFTNRWTTQRLESDVHVGDHRPFNLAEVAATHAGFQIEADELSMPELVLSGGVTVGCRIGLADASDAAGEHDNDAQARSPA